MFRSCSYLVLATAFQVIFGQAEKAGKWSPPIHGFQRQTMAVPNHCLAPPPGIDLYKCCPIPQIFSDEETDLCGIGKTEKQLHDNPPKSKKHCQESKCLMRNAGLLRANQSVDYEKLREFVDKWATIDPDFTEAIYGAKRVCANEGVLSGPPVCETDGIFICLTSNVLWNCKLRNLGGTGECQRLKEHMDECRPYYYTQKEQEEIESRNPRY